MAGYVPHSEKAALAYGRRITPAKPLPGSLARSRADYAPLAEGLSTVLASLNEGLSADTIETKRTLTALIQELTAGSRPLKACGLPRRATVRQHVSNWQSPRHQPAPSTRSPLSRPLFSFSFQPTLQPNFRLQPALVLPCRQEPSCTHRPLSPRRRNTCSR